MLQIRLWKRLRACACAECSATETRVMASRPSQINAILWVVACLVVMISRCHAGLQHTCSSDTRTQTPRGICGRSLANILQMLCKTGYNKRSGPPAGTYWRGTCLAQHAKLALSGGRKNNWIVKSSKECSTFNCLNWDDVTGSFYKRKCRNL